MGMKVKKVMMGQEGGIQPHVRYGVELILLNDELQGHVVEKQSTGENLLCKQLSFSAYLDLSLSFSLPLSLCLSSELRSSALNPFCFRYTPNFFSFLFTLFISISQSGLSLQFLVFVLNFEVGARSSIWGFGFPLWLVSEVTDTVGGR
ncbi:hypothetical protein VNO80_26966 [Phaseolus coccineus]|uniref:Uncharacterized protein n=1 Tax=Phaseolus coccineus TaxID=3886 RepID=A0AAN9LFP5_PHACN